MKTRTSRIVYCGPGLWMLWISGSKWSKSPSILSYRSQETAALKSNGRVAGQRRDHHNHIHHHHHHHHHHQHHHRHHHHHHLIYYTEARRQRLSRAIAVYPSSAEMTESNPVATKSQVVAWCHHIVILSLYYCVILSLHCRIILSLCHSGIVAFYHCVITPPDMCCWWAAVWSRPFQAKSTIPNHILCTRRAATSDNHIGWWQWRRQGWL